MREETGLDPVPAGRNFPRGFHGPFPSTDCTDTNFILQVLKAQKRGPHWCGEGADPAMPVAVSSCRGRGGFGTPQPPGLCPLGRVPAPAGDAAVACGCQAGLSPAPSPGAGRDCPHSGLTLPPTSQASAGAPRDGGCPLGSPHPAGLQLSSHRGLWGHSGDRRDRARDSDRRQGRGWRGRLQGSAGLRTAWPRWGRTAAGARWTGRSWPL